jgi:hypothetical protein
VAVGARGRRNRTALVSGWREAVKSLAYAPCRCPLAPENAAFDFEVRQLLYGRKPQVYRILYTIEGDTVSIGMFATDAASPSPSTDVYLMECPESRSLSQTSSIISVSARNSNCSGNDQGRV